MHTEREIKKRLLHKLYGLMDGERSGAQVDDMGIAILEEALHTARIEGRKEGYGKWKSEGVIATHKEAYLEGRKHQRGIDAEIAKTTKFERFEEDGRLRVTYNGVLEIAKAIENQEIEVRDE